jgi:hypothetical protein
VNGSAAERAEIVRFWRSVELFSPPSVERVDVRRRRYPVRSGAPLPWEPEHQLAREHLGHQRSWRHVVYLGVYGLETVRELVEERLGRDDESFDERPGGESALAALGVSDKGQLLPGSTILSSCAWAAGRVAHDEKRGPGWLSGFEHAQGTLQLALEDLVGDRVLDMALLEHCVAAAAATAGINGVLEADEIRVRTDEVHVAATLDADSHDFLNSFFIRDLSDIADALETGDAGEALTAYLQADEGAFAARRVDVRHALDEVVAATAPAKVPLGRWPAAPDRPLALGQQLAVNEILQMGPDGAGLFGVNGPPGTGKTTMLRDVIAAVVVERAQRLAELAHPRDAFDGVERWRTGDYTRTVQRWIPALTGFELVVASANNGAVENVTHDIPGVDAIDASWRAAAEDLDYFAELASTLLEGDRAAWGLVAAPLGRQQRRISFVQRCMWGAKDEDDERPAGLYFTLKRYEREGPPPAEDWAQAVRTFTRAVADASEFQTDRARAYAALIRQPPLEAELNDAEHARADAQQRESTAQARVTETERDFEAALAEQERWEARRADHRADKPGLVERVTSLGRAMREWRGHANALTAEVATAERAADDARTACASAVNLASRERAAVTAADRQIARCARELTDVRACLAEAQQALGDQFPDAGWHSDEARTRREAAAPWIDTNFNAARSQLFLAALQLHKEFLRHVPAEMHRSLLGAIDVLNGTAPRDLPEEKAMAAWHALFFVVPVVSTTFASFARMFSHLGQESLGWLLIDEGGQATPQSAVGALWRARRAVVVGDPLQLEPIVAVSSRIQRSLAREHGVDDRWVPNEELSAQRLADRVTRLGTWLPDRDGRIWVGAPLTVHRRCDDPMFQFVNRLAYDHTMIHATGLERAAAFDERFRLPASKWIDVTSTESDGHWIPAEGEQLDLILSALRSRGLDMAQVLAIAPFRDGAHRLRQRIRRYDGLTAGTIHTVQGKEADVVILVLGGDLRKPGARGWAARKPNLLNVAASRARRRLYVVGNWEAWAPHRHFDVLAQHLQRESPVEGRGSSVV